VAKRLISIDTALAAGSQLPAAVATEIAARIVDELDLTAAGRALLDDADAAAQRSTLSAVGKGELLINVKDYGAIGDGTTDDLAAIQAAVDAASALATSTGQRVKVLIPPGVYRCNNALLAKSNTVVENQGHLRFHGGNNVGHFVAIIAQHNIELYGGVWDSNAQTNDNTIGISFFTNPQHTEFGSRCENIFIHDMVIKNSKHGGSHITDINDPDDVGRGGGKGITVQFGCKNVLVSDVVIENCDLGLSVEGKETNGGYCEDVVIQNVIIRNCKYMGLFLSSAIATPSLYGTTTSLSLSNIEIVDCGVGQTTEGSPQDIATLFGAITCQGMLGVQATNIRVRSTTGKLTAFRGAMRHTDWDIQVFVAGEMIDFVNTAPYGGYIPALTASRYNTVKAQLNLMGAFSGHFVNSDATYGALWSEYDIRAIYYVGSTPTTIPTAQYSTGLPTDSTGSYLSVLDYHTGIRSSVASAATPSTLALRDSNANLTADNYISTTTSTVTAAGTTTLTIASSQVQVFTGSTTQTVLLPTTGVVAGQTYTIINQSSGAVTVQSSGANGINTITAGLIGIFIAKINAPTAAADWQLIGWRISSAAAGNSGALRDANGHLFAVNFIPSATSTVTAAGTTTLTIASSQTQVFTGTTTQTVLLPTTSVVAGQMYTIVNNSSGTVTVQSSGANTVQTVLANTLQLFIAQVSTPTTAAHWRAIGPAV
jgi:hypothetical protein